MDFDWHKLFVPDQPILDCVIRGYLMLFLIFRFLLRRRAGGLGTADVLVVVLIADASAKCDGQRIQIRHGGCCPRVDHRVLDNSHRRPCSPAKADTSAPTSAIDQTWHILSANLRQEMITPGELFSLRRAIRSSWSA